MRNLNKLSASQLLACKEPEKLFTGSIEQVKQEYKALVLLWHPDQRGNHSEVISTFLHIQKLYQEAVRKLESNNWIEPADKIENEKPNEKRWRVINEALQFRTIQYKSCFDFVLGNCYIANNIVVYEIKNEYKDLFNNAMLSINSFKFSDHAMQAKMMECLPQVITTFKTQTHSIVVLRKTPDLLLLKDLLAHYGGSLANVDKGHVGWILNTLYNIACYLQYSNLTHNDISLETVFVSPLKHTAMLLGGWWYSKPMGARMAVLPSTTIKFTPPDILKNKYADTRVDLELIKQIGRTVLGGVNRFSDLPKPLVNFLTMPSPGSAVDDYALYRDKVLRESFGPPKFVKLDITADELYKE